MDKEKLKELQSSSDVFADRMGWPRMKVNVDFHEAIAKGGGRASFDLILPPANAARPRKIIHRLKTRKSVLDDEIELARTKALNPNAAASVFAELVKLADQQEGCLLGVDEDAVKYQIGAEVKFFTVRHLRARLKRADAR
jgi:hypothetical protein